MGNEHHYGRLFLTGVLTVVGAAGLLIIAVLVFGKKTPTTQKQLHGTTAKEAINKVSGGAMWLEADKLPVSEGDVVTVYVMRILRRPQ
jgi:hypothetical protein